MSLVGSVCTGLIALCLVSGPSLAAEPEVPPAANLGETEPAKSAETNYQQLLQAILLLEERLRSNQLAFELSSLELKREASRSAEALSNGLETIEKALSAQQEAFSVRSARELETIQSSNRAMLVVGGTFAAITALAMLLVAYFQWRMSRVWADISSAFPMVSRLGGGSAVTAVGAGAASLAGTAAVESSNARLLGAVERLEKRVHELEAGSDAAVEPHARAFLSRDNGDSPGSGNGDETGGAGPPSAKPDARVGVLLKQGQSLLKENNLEAALTCYNELLALDPNQTEALVKKGAVLERLHKVNEAFECYDRAITADGSMTMAYLYKGGLCSRLERFREALECYEKALRTHDEGHG